MIQFYKDSYGITVYFGGARNSGVVTVNGDIKLDLDESMTFGEERIVKVQRTETKTLTTGYTDGNSTVLPAEFQAWKDSIKNDPNISQVEKDIRSQVLDKTWRIVTENKEEIVDVPFIILPLQNTEDYRLIPVRCSRTGDKPVYFTVRDRSEWLFPYIIKKLAEFGFTKVQDTWRHEKKTYSLDLNYGLKIEGNEILSDAEKKEVFQLQFMGTVEECQKRINDIIDMVEDKINLWWKVKQRADGITVGEILSSLKHIKDKVATLDIKKNDASDKAAVIRMIEEQQKKMVEYARSIPNPTPEQVAYESAS